MATWAEQGGREEVEPIPQCPYIVRRGQTPDFRTRSNILPWQEALAAHPEKWRPLVDAEGQFIVELPSMDEPPPGVYVTEADAPHIAERKINERNQAAAKADLQEVQVFSVFASLEDADFKPNGMPKVDVVRERTGLELTGTQVKDYWNAYLKGREGVQ